MDYLKPLFITVDYLKLIKINLNNTMNSLHSTVIIKTRAKGVVGVAVGDITANWGF